MVPDYFLNSLLYQGMFVIQLIVRNEDDGIENNSVLPEGNGLAKRWNYTLSVACIRDILEWRRVVTPGPMLRLPDYGSHHG